jgi:hypothetical protein
MSEIGHVASAAPEGTLLDADSVSSGAASGAGCRGEQNGALVVVGAEVEGQVRCGPLAAGKNLRGLTAAAMSARQSLSLRRRRLLRGNTRSQEGVLLEGKLRSSSSRNRRIPSSSSGSSKRLVGGGGRVGLQERAKLFAEGLSEPQVLAPAAADDARGSIAIPTPAAAGEEPALARHTVGLAGRPQQAGLSPSLVFFSSNWAGEGPYSWAEESLGPLRLGLQATAASQRCSLQLELLGSHEDQSGTLQEGVRGISTSGGSISEHPLSPKKAPSDNGALEIPVIVPDSPTVVPACWVGNSSSPFFDNSAASGGTAQAAGLGCDTKEWTLEEEGLLGVGRRGVVEQCGSYGWRRNRRGSVSTEETAGDAGGVDTVQSHRQPTFSRRYSKKREKQLLKQQRQQQQQQWMEPRDSSQAAEMHTIGSSANYQHQQKLLSAGEVSVLLSTGGGVSQQQQHQMLQDEMGSVEALLPPAPATPETLGLFGPLYDLIDCVFQLRSKGLFRRNVILLGRQLLSFCVGGAIEDYLQRKIEKFTTEQNLANMLVQMQAMMWPGGVWYMYAAAGPAAAPAVAAEPIAAGETNQHSGIPVHTTSCRSSQGGGTHVVPQKASDASSSSSTVQQTEGNLGQDAVPYSIASTCHDGTVSSSSMEPGGGAGQTTCTCPTAGGTSSSSSSYVRRPPGMQASTYMDFAVAPTDSAEVAEGLRRKLLELPVPPGMGALLGRGAYQYSLAELFQVLQSEVLMMHLGNTLMERFLVALFPEVKGGIAHINNSAAGGTNKWQGSP